MFDIGGGELLVIGVVALLVVKPKDLPGMFRTVGNAMGKVRRMANDFRWQFDEAMREAEIDQAKKAFTDINDAARSVKPSFNPIDTIRSEIQSVKEEIRGASTASASIAAAVQATPLDVLPDPMPLTPPAPPPLPAAAPVAAPVPPAPVTAASPPPAAVPEPEPEPKRRKATAKTTDAAGGA